jgi:monoamine oxidase
MPPSLWTAIAWDPPLDARRTGLARRDFPGALGKCFAVYDEPWWREDGCSGEAVSDRGPATITFDVSPPAGRPGVLLGFVGGTEAHWAAGAPEEERRDHVLGTFARLFGRRALTPTAWIEKQWAGDPWVGGGPTGCLGPGALTAHGACLREDAGVVLFAGTETSPVWTGYMEGAVRSGERAAAAALGA